MLFECIPYSLLTVGSPNCTLEGVDYKIDYSKESIKLFETNYNKKNIIINQKFKEDYENLFQVKYVNFPESQKNNYLKVEFKFTKFCEMFNIDFDDYIKMKENHQNFYPFPLIINLIIMKDKEKIKCTTYAEMLTDFNVLLSFIDNNFVIIYKYHDYCIFKFIEDLDEKEKELVERCKKKCLTINHS